MTHGGRCRPVAHRLRQLRPDVRAVHPGCETGLVGVGRCALAFGRMGGDAGAAEPPLAALILTKI
jgi:hypothetical protein